MVMGFGALMVTGILLEGGTAPNVKPPVGIAALPGTPPGATPPHVSLEWIGVGVDVCAAAGEAAGVLCSRLAIFLCMASLDLLQI
jgi:hypothetical protein